MSAPAAHERVVGIIGDPVAHSLSPRMHTVAFEMLGIGWRFVAFHVPAAYLADASRGIRTLGLAGVNVTAPHKQAVTALLDDLDTSAREIGAVNTVRVEGGRLVGYNTDAPGSLDALQRDGGVALAGARCLLLGAGGAGRSAAFALAGAGVRSIVILNRTPARAEDVAARVAAAHPAVRIAAGPLGPTKVYERRVASVRPTTRLVSRNVSTASRRG